MSISTRIISCFVVILSIGFYCLFVLVVSDLEPQYRKSTEDPLVDTSRVLASLASASMQGGKVDITLFRHAFEHAYEQSFQATVYDFDKARVDLHVYITDAQGIVLFDSKDEREIGKDYSNWRDVYLTMRGKYGARTTHLAPQTHRSSVMYIAAPIIKNGDLIGVLSVGKPTENANNFVGQAKERVVFGILVTLAASVLMAIFLTRMLTIPLAQLSEYAQAVRDGKRVSLPRLGKSEIARLGASFEEMRSALEGKKYVENYVQTFTHEIKSPLAAVQGALEIIKENPAPEQRERFLHNMTVEIQRMKDIVERMLVLSTVEARDTIADPSEIQVRDLINEINESFLPLLENKRISLTTSGDLEASFQGERFLIRQALANIVQNAIQFGGDGALISISVKEEAQSICFSIQDNGPGIPEYARAKIFDRFFSLPRPDTGKKSSGLGLSLVKEVAALHGGDVSIESSALGGANVLFKIGRVVC